VHGELIVKPLRVIPANDGLHTMLGEEIAVGLVLVCLTTIIHAIKALRVAALLSPVLRFYQVVLYPVAKPTAKVLDLWLGPEGVHFSTVSVSLQTPAVLYGAAVPGSICAALSKV
jgi:CBS domain containing-hemolysin-like protein